MGFLAFLGFLNAIFQTAGNGASSGQTIFNLYKDLNNLDIHRQEDSQKRLMEEALNQNYELMASANDFNERLMDKQQGFNVQNMAQQYTYNRYLSDLGRSIYAERDSGINPAKGVVASTGSVSLPSVSTPAMSGSSASIPSANASHYTPSVSNANPMAALESLSDSQLKQTQSDLNETEVKTLNDKNLATVMKLRAEAQKYYKEAGLSEVEANIRLKAFDDIVESYKNANAKTKAEAAAAPVHAEAAKTTAEATKVAADAAQKQADNSAEANEIRRGELREEVRWHDLQNAIDKARTKLYGDEVAIKNYLAPYQQAELVQMAKKLNSETVITDKEADAFADKLRAYLGLNDARIKELEAKARNEAAMAGLNEKESDWYVYHQIENTVFRTADTIGSILPWYGAKGAVNKQKIISSMVDHQNYMTPTGYKGYRQKTTYEYGE